MKEGPLLLTPEAAAERLSVGRTTMYGLIASGRIQSVKIGRARRVLATALTEYVSSLTEQPEADG